MQSSSTPTQTVSSNETPEPSEPRVQTHEQSDHPKPEERGTEAKSEQTIEHRGVEPGEPPRPQTTQAKQTAAPRIHQAPLPPASIPKSEVRREIEQILSEDLSEVFASLDEAHRRDFKLKGEETATQIERLIETAKFTVKKVVTLLKEWLKIIPHLNAFFFEQVLKIKTDRIVNLNARIQRDRVDHLS